MNKFSKGSREQVYRRTGGDPEGSRLAPASSPFREAKVLKRSTPISHLSHFERDPGPTPGMTEKSYVRSTRRQGRRLRYNAAGRHRFKPSPVTRYLSATTQMKQKSRARPFPIPHSPFPIPHSLLLYFQAGFIHLSPGRHTA